jgi:hypothetical protein
MLATTTEMMPLVATPLVIAIMQYLITKASY